MGKLPNIDLRAGWDTSLCQEGVKWGNLSSSLHPACVWDVYSQDAMGRYRWVLKDGLKQPSSATGPSSLGSMGPRAGQVKTWTNYQVGLSVLCHGTKSTPTICPPNKTPTPATTMVKSSLLRPTVKQSTPRHHHLPWHHLLVLAWHQSLPMAPPLRAPRVALLAPALLPAPKSPTRPLPPSGSPWVGHPTPVPCRTPDLAQARSTSLPHPSSTVASEVTAAWAF